MSETVTLYEVGPRDGLQNLAVRISTGDKLELVGRLVDAGLRQVELTSFVSPRAVPQLADAPEVAIRAVRRWPEVQFVGLVITEQGYERALEAGLRSVALVVIASETLSRRNSGVGTARCLAVCRKVVERARRERIWTRIYLSAAWGCPYEGPLHPHRAIALADRILEGEPDQLALADSSGCASPLEVGRLVESVGARAGMDRLAVHLHDGAGSGLANAEAAVSAGVRILDASVGGLGGCPFAPGVPGNLPTHRLAELLHARGLETGVDPVALARAAEGLGALFGRARNNTGPSAPATLEVRRSL